MKKLFFTLTLLTAVGLPAGASAGSNADVNSLTTDGPQYIRVERDDMAAVLPKPARRDNDEPTAKTTLYVRNSTYISPIFGTTYVRNESKGSVGESIIIDGKDIYIYPLVTAVLGATYVQGSIDKDSVITFEFPQHIGTTTTGLQVDYYVMKYAGDPGSSQVGPCEVIKDQTYHMRIHPDGSITPIEEDQEKWIGWSPDGKQFMGYADSGYLFQPQTQTAVTPPEGSNETIYTWANKEVGRFANVVFDADTMYIQNLFPLMPEGWVKGVKKDAGYVFKGSQLLGIRDDNVHEPYWYYAYGVDQEIVNQPPYGDVPLFTVTDGFTFEIKGEDFFVGEPAPYATRIREIGDQYLSFDHVNNNGYLKKRDQLHKLGTPATPEFLNCTLWAKEETGLTYDQTYVRFDFSQFATEGFLIYPEDLFYEVFVDGKPYEFKTEDFPGIPEGGLKLVPYVFKDSNSTIYDAITSWSSIHQFTLPLGAEKIGLRGVCVVDGQTRYSEIAEFDLLGLTTPVADSKVESVSYYDLTGKQVSKPQNGLYIKTSILSDGSVKTEKLFIR